MTESLPGRFSTAVLMMLCGAPVIVSWGCDSEATSPRTISPATVPVSSGPLFPTTAAVGGTTPLPFPPDPADVADLHAHSVAVVEKARRKLPQLVDPIFQLGDVHRRFGFDEQAVEAYRRGLARSPDRPGVFNTIGFLLSQRNRFQEAKDAYSAALALDPRTGVTRTRLGLIFAHEGRLEEAIPQYQGEVENGTATVETFYNLGQALLQTKRYEKAESAFRDCLRLDPQHHNATYGLFQVCRGQGETAAAEEHLQRFRALREAEVRRQAERLKKKSTRERDLRYTAETYMDVAQLYRRAGLSTDSKRALIGAVIFDSGFVDAQLALVDLLRRNGRSEEALEHGRQAVEASPDDPRLLYLVAGLYADNKEHLEATNLLSRLVELQPGSSNAHRELARAVLFGRVFDEDSGRRALPHARKAVEMERSAPNLDILSFALFLVGQRDEAIDALQAASELDPGNEALKARLKKVRGY